MDRLQDRLQMAMKQKLGGERNRWKDQYRGLLSHTPQVKLQRLTQQNEQYRHRMERAMGSYWRIGFARQDHLIGKLDALSPLKVMGRGYALVFKQDTEERKLVKSVEQVQFGDWIQVKLSDGDLTCEV